MSNNYQFSNNQLTANAKIYVEGTVSFSHISKHIEGEALQKDKARKIQMGMSPIDKPYTTISIKDAKIHPQNPAQLTLEEQFIQERFYLKTDAVTNQQYYGYTVNNKSPYLPTVSQYHPDKNTASQVDIDGKELATGLKVILCLSVFQSKNFSNKGIGLDNIIVMEPIQYYNAGNTDLSALGITYQPLPGDAARNAVTPNANVANNATETPVTPVSEPTGNAFATQNNMAAQQATPIPQATPVQNAQAAPVQQATTAPTPAATQPATQPAMNAPISEPESPWICPSCGTTNPAGQKFCGNCGSQKVENNSVNNPYAQQVNPVQPTQGIVYNADPTNRDY